MKLRFLQVSRDQTFHLGLIRAHQTQAAPFSIARTTIYVLLPIPPERQMQQGVRRGEARSNKIQMRRGSVPPKGTVQRRRPSQERAKATREHILDVAAQLFGERGIADTSTNRIATQAQVSIGTVYRYFSDRTVMVEELLVRLLGDIEQRFTAQLFDLPDSSILDLVTVILEVIAEEVIANAPLVRAIIGGVQFYSSGLPEFEPRLRMLVKLMVIQILGPGDDHRYDDIALVLLNTGFAVVLRASTLEDSSERDTTIALTAKMMAGFLDSERSPAQAEQT
ncbi:TetR/AcrR family transcriptional regulator [Nocardia fluminea]|uniref:TetR/AcrR family transcriptional regulator n=1 Tax=Nocardia fluminea TaxID=134984 RepID=UPI003D11D326